MVKLMWITFERTKSVLCLEELTRIIGRKQYAPHLIIPINSLITEESQIHDNDNNG